MSTEIVKGFPSTLGDDYQLNVITILRHAARTYPEREVVSRHLDGSILRYNYRQAYERVKKLANVLKRLGVKPGDRVGALDWNTHRYNELYYGVAGVGAVLLQLNPRISFPDRSYVVNHSEAKLIFISDSLLPVIEPIAGELKTVAGYVVITDKELLEIKTGLRPLYSYEELLKEAGAEFAWPVIDEKSAYSACYTDRKSVV